MNNHESVLEAIAGITKLSTELVEMKAIWLDKPLQMEGKRSIRIANGDKVLVMYPTLAMVYLADCTEGTPATHIVTACRGTIYSTLLEIEVRELKTNEVLTIKL